MVTLRNTVLQRTACSELLLVGGTPGSTRKTEQLLAVSEQAAAELYPGLVLRDRRRQQLREFDAVPPEKGEEHPGAEPPLQALAVAPDADGAAQQRHHPRGQDGVAAVQRILRVAQEVGETCLVPFGPSGLRCQAVGHPDQRPHIAEEFRNHDLAAGRCGDEAATVAVNWNTHSQLFSLPTRKPVSSEQITDPANRR